MEDILTTGQDLDALARKRAKLMARLTRRHVENGDRCITASAEMKSAHHELDQLLDKANEELNNGQVIPETVKQLEDCLSLQSGRSAKRIQEILASLRRVSIAKNSSLERKAFSFVIRPSDRKKDPAADSRITAKNNLCATTPCNIISNADSQDRITSLVSDTTVVLENKIGLSDRISGKSGSSITLKNLTGCTLKFTFRPSAVHMQDITDCALYFLPVDSSILMHHVNNSSIFAGAQQIRVHNSSNVTFHVAVRGAIIFEACTRMYMAPYRATFEGVAVEVPEGEQWRNPSDFDWLAEGQSPNWTILPDSQWKQVSI